MMVHSASTIDWYCWEKVSFGRVFEEKIGGKSREKNMKNFLGKLWRGTHIGVLYTDLGVVLLRFQLELDVQGDDLGIGKLFRLLFETSVRECLLEGDTVYKIRIAQRTSRLFFDTDEVQSEVFVQIIDGIDDHLGEKFTVRSDEFRVESGGGTSLQELSLLSVFDQKNEAGKMRKGMRNTI
jgi:hypothetical protein